MEVSPKRSRPRLERVVHQDASWVAHKKSGLLHFCWTEPSGGDPDRKMTACGRTVSKNFAAGMQFALSATVDRIRKGAAGPSVVS